MCVIHDVSVPLRGKYRGEGEYEYLGATLNTHVSVPLRGKYRGEELNITTTMLWIFLKFPSPCGVNIVAKGYELFRIYHQSVEFPSPCGVNIVAKNFSDRFKVFAFAWFPSPCGVNIVAKLKTALYPLLVLFSCFRPLAG